MVACLARALSSSESLRLFLMGSVVKIAAVFLVNS